MIISFFLVGEGWLQVMGPLDPDLHIYMNGGNIACACIHLHYSELRMEYLCTYLSNTYIHAYIHTYIHTSPDRQLMITFITIWPSGVVEGGDRQPVPRAKLFCLRFCGRIEFVARFTLMWDKHFFWSWIGGKGGARGEGPEGRSYSIGRQT